MFRPSAPRSPSARPRPRWSWIREIDPDDISLYVGIPFCPSRCYYCSFVSSTTAQSGALIEPYLETLCGEIRETAALVRQAGKRVQSIYIGGGTPTTLSAEQLARLTGTLADSFDLSALREYFTVEAGRPDTITPEKLRVLKTPASAASASIRSPWRTACSPPSAESTRRPMCCVRLTRRGQAGFREINMDVIAGLTGDTPGDLCAYHRHAHRARPENITVHTLAIKRGADLTDKRRRPPHSTTVSRMLDYAYHALPQAGYGPYYLYRQKFIGRRLRERRLVQTGTECFG